MKSKKNSIAGLMLFIVGVILIVYLIGCGESVPASSVQTNDSTADAKLVETPKLTWEDPKFPNRHLWSVFLLNRIAEDFDVFDMAKDNASFCPKYSVLNKQQKVQMMAELLVGVMLYESGWKPTSWMIEPGMGKDPVTGHQVKSEGLLQLSYQDIKPHPFCKFDWQKDKALSQDDPKKTIMDPFKNMDCGIGILKKQIAKRGSFTLPSNVYWSVLKIDGKYSKIAQIKMRTKALPFCK